MVNRKKFSVLFGILCFSVIIAGAVIMQSRQSDKSRQSDEFLYTQEYIPGQGNIKGNVDVASFLALNENYDIGANSYGYAVFKNPQAAFTAFTEQYSTEIESVQKEFNLDPLTETDYDLYKMYAFEITGDSDAERQARFISKFLDIYENSFAIQ